MSSRRNALLPQIGIRALLSLFLAEGRFRKNALPVTAEPPFSPFFELFEHVGAERSAVERFISQRFNESFGSRVEIFMPRLFSLRNQDGDICGAFGMRSANRKLFLEQFLDAPIEKAIGARIGSRVERHDIVEIGHFSGAFPGAVRTMIELLTERLYAEGFEWVVFTGTTTLRNAFSRLGLSPMDIHAAMAERLPEDERAAWGNYYNDSPRVLAGNVSGGHRAIHRRAGSRNKPPGKPL